MAIQDDIRRLDMGQRDATIKLIAKVLTELYKSNDKFSP
jgi:hypothetical protein